MTSVTATTSICPRFRRTPSVNRVERGISIVELMIAITVLAVGMAGLAGLFSMAIMNNGRSKGDTTGTMLAQTVLEKIASQPANSATNLTVTDCNPAGATNWAIATAGVASPGNGATLDATGAIDFINQTYAAVTANYKMQFVACGNNGRQVTYDVRWNIQTITANSRLITVSARPLAAASGGKNQALLFALPVTLRTIGGL